jgi:amino acid permease
MATTAEHQPLVLELDRRAQSSIHEDGEDETSSTGEEESCYTGSYDGNGVNQNIRRHEGSSVIQTALNMTKLCMGTGTLALPFAAEKGGLVFNVIGLALIALWNYYCANCVIRCRDCLPPRIKRGDSDLDAERSLSRQQQVYGSIEGHERLQRDNRSPPPEGTTPYSEVAWYAAGNVGLVLVDVLMLLLSVMLIIAYEVAMISFIDDLPITTGSRKIDIIIPSVIVALLSCSPDVSFLSKFSIVGLLALALSFCVIVWQGLVENGLIGFQSTLNLWPTDLTAASSWFGVVVFGYGIVPFILNFQESMSNPKQIGPAMKMGLILVFFAYIIISNGVRILFSPSHSFDGDVLQALPKNSWIALIVRLLMTFVISVTAPLIVVPCGSMIEGKLGIGMNELYKRISIRVLLCVLCTLCSEFAPGFVHIVSFIGCFCVSIVGFVLPPLFCIQLRHNTRKDSMTMDYTTYCDVSALVIGIITTILTSTMTFGELRRSQQ